MGSPAAPGAGRACCVRTRPPPSPATMRNAMSASVIDWKKAPVSTQMLTCWMFVINAHIPPKTKVLDLRFLPSFHPLAA
jgi:hypothetical protein